MAGGTTGRGRHRRHPHPGEIDRWTAERTLAIERFPILLTPDVMCLLASALATRVSWEVPFDVVDAAALGAGPGQPGYGGCFARREAIPAIASTSRARTGQARSPCI